MDYQIDSRNHRSQEVRVGESDQEVAAFRKVNFFIQNLKAEVGGLDYEMKLAAPWNGFRYQLVQAGRVIATAKRHGRMHAFDASRPLHRHPLAEFELDVSGRTMTLTPLDRHGTTFRLDEGGTECGRLAMRPFDAQRGGEWQEDLTAPLGWSAPLAAWIGWLAREGRSRMSK
ncbi:MAG: hypothetical protein AB7U83_24040 [Vicinamibacterales bacterium]